MFPSLSFSMLYVVQAHLKYDVDMLAPDKILLCRVLPP